MEKYRYYVIFSYLVPGNGGSLLRNDAAEYDCDGPMEEERVRNRVVADLRQHYTAVTIINWKRIE